MTNSNDVAFFGEEGLTKLEYFATMALQGLLANPNTNISHEADEMEEVVIQAIDTAEWFILHLSTKEKEEEEYAKAKAALESLNDKYKPIE
jgi:hypothetical protein